MPFEKITSVANVKQLAQLDSANAVVLTANAGAGPAFAPRPARWPDDSQDHCAAVVQFPRITAAVVLMTTAAHSQQPPAIALRDGVFTVTAFQLPPTEPRGGWGTLFLVYAGAGNVPPLAGSYSVETNRLAFHPRYPVAAGVRYHAVFKTVTGALITRDFDGPTRDTKPSARVKKIYPTADILPANQLRIFVIFSAPMSRGEAAAHLRLEDAEGRTLAYELLPGQELWDPEFRRLTMTFDPGRIKRGLTSNTTIGPPITEGKRYRLVLDCEWPDARGVPLVEGCTKTFTGGPPIRLAPKPSQWRITPPARSITAPVVIDFPNPMNYALLERLIQVRRGATDIEGVISLARNERQWRFTPATPWQPGDYRLVVDNALEDIAGNRSGSSSISIFSIRSRNPSIGELLKSLSRFTDRSRIANEN